MIEFHYLQLGIDTTFVGVYLTSNDNSSDYYLELNLLRRKRKRLEMDGQNVVFKGDFNGTQKK